MEQAGECRRRLHKLTPRGWEMLAAQRSVWDAFVTAINRITAVGHA